MEKAQAINFIRDVFTQPFDKERFRHFTRELLNRYDPPNSPQMLVPDAFMNHIQSCQRLGTYRSPSGELLDILIVNVLEDYKIERTRTALRDFVGHKLKRGDNYKEAALVAFVPPSSQNWRFSYVRMEYETIRDAKTGLIKPEERLTPARRYSYLVGINEKSHTAQKQLLSLLETPKNKQKGDPELSAIEQAFSVEKVTKEFFSEYARLFETTEKALAELVNKDEILRIDFEAKNVSTVNFTKKLLGQIVFLYFIQKKGWLGVPKGGKWGDGPQNFLRQIAEKAHRDEKNIFNDVLEHLFYKTLADDRGHEAWCTRFQCRIPFLNGGLFEPLAGYDWEKTEINLPNSIFTNRKISPQGDTGTGILDVFDRYNFTVNEAEPLEKEVAIDPEMLGKVFENLIEENRRKGLGAFYTPREIVHYMCQESLINYLDTGLNRTTEKNPSPLAGEGRGEGAILRKELEEWIHQSDQYAHYASAIETGMLKGDHYPKPPESIRKYAREIDDLLRDITVCDPAIGSGAFPVGMMMEVVRARTALNPYLSPSPLMGEGRGEGELRTPYHFKRHAIQNSLYGVDIDASAVEIAKLRLWLSLVVDEEDVQQIKPLPNLDYKIVVGNSLLGVEKTLFNHEQFRRLEELKPRYFDATDRKQKEKFKHEIDDLIHKLTSGKKAFDFEIYFSEVFHNKKGFDIILANPPYVGQKGNKDLFQRLKKHSSWRAFYERKQDLYYYFLVRGISLLSETGNLTYIIPPYFLTAAGAGNLKNYIKNNATISKILNLSEKVKVFFEASINNIVIFIDKKKTGKLIEIVEPIFDAKVQDLDMLIRTANQYKSPYSMDSLPSDEWHIFKRIEEQVFTLRDEVLPLGLIARISPGIQTGCDRVTEKHIEKYKLKGCSKGDGIFIISDDELKQLKPSAHEMEFIKPFFKNSDIQKWCHEKRNSKWILITNNIQNIKKYPNIERHLLKYRKIIDARYRNFALLNADKEHRWWILYGYRPNTNFDGTKVILPYRSSSNTFAYSNTPFYGSIDVFYINMHSNQFEEKYVCAVLCSSFIKEWLSQNCKKKGQIFELYQRPLSQIPIKCISPDAQKPFIKLVDHILVAKWSDPKADTSALELELDEMVYALYDLTKEEIEIVERAGEK